MRAVKQKIIKKEGRVDYDKLRKEGYSDRFLAKVEVACPLSFIFSQPHKFHHGEVQQRRGPLRVFQGIRISHSSRQLADNFARRQVIGFGKLNCSGQVGVTQNVFFAHI
ncbi:MAG TPA: hypothetical protein VF430_09765, partial [Verrucomicrobiae bacterium]